MCSDKVMPVHFNIHVDETNWLAGVTEASQYNQHISIYAYSSARQLDYGPRL